MTASAHVERTLVTYVENLDGIKRTPNQSVYDDAVDDIAKRIAISFSSAENVGIVVQNTKQWSCLNWWERHDPSVVARELHAKVSTYIAMYEHLDGVMIYMPGVVRVQIPQLGADNRWRPGLKKTGVIVRVITPLTAERVVYVLCE